MKKMEPKINMCQEMQSRVAARSVDAGQNQAEDIDWDMEDILELTDETVRSWMPAWGREG